MGLISTITLLTTIWVSTLANLTDVPFSVIQPVVGTRAQVLVQPGAQIRQLSYFWKLVIFMDLKPYAIERDNILAIVGNIKTLCDHSDFTIQKVCGKYLKEITSLSSQITDLHQLFITDHFGNQIRQRRGLLDGAGTLGKFLFGIMDANDHQVISTEINDLRESQHQQKHLLLETTTLVKIFFKLVLFVS